VFFATVAEQLVERERRKHLLATSFAATKGPLIRAVASTRLLNRSEISRGGIISSEVKMNYKVVVHESEEGFSVSCPGLPGCWSQGQTEAEALENIQDAIREYLAAVDDLVSGQDVREVRVAG